MLVRAARLESHFVRAPEAARPAKEEAEQGPAGGALGLDRLKAQGDASFIASRGAGTQAKRPPARVRVGGAEIFYDNANEQLSVPTAGTLLIERYDAEAPDSESGPAAAFAGPGRTLLQWGRRMRLDTFHRTLRAVGAVRMAHEPLGPRAPVRLRCERFRTDFRDTGGGAVLEGGPRPDAKLQSAEAKGAVRLFTEGRRLEAQRLNYSRAAQRVRVTSEPPARARLLKRGAAGRLTAQSIEWNLSNNRIEAVEVGARGGG
jgi:hypothetical protein